MKVFINGTLLPWNAEHLSWLWSLGIFDQDGSELESWIISFRYLSKQGRFYDGSSIKGFAKIALDRCLECRSFLIQELGKLQEVEDPVMFVDLWMKALLCIIEVADASDKVVFSSDQKPPSREEAMKLLAALDKAHQKLQDEP